MKKIAITFFAMLGCVAIVTSTGVAAEPSKKRNRSQMENITRVDRVSLALIKTNPPKLSIDAKGMAASMGWSNPTLVPRVYVQPPPDGIYDYDFQAKPPTGIVPQVLTPISATLVVPEIPTGLKGVRVHSKTNSKVAKLK